ncbi:Hint domain-containing protein [Palleronia caenipelagi]|uniref:Hint domain-containing protein n=1 Tax=Palleronia caenipelagi TaxID=2489174 RepID=A0A547PMA8_9RHOB|nr:Hint domain-containing protein [Palleronia caenipelagi]TRD15279.1 Hint domain-containing protein [Palleronia caenipelagi]
MAVLNVDLGGSQTVVIDSSNALNGDLLAISALGSSTLIVDGVDVGISSIASVSIGAQPTLIARDGGSISIDQGLLSADLLNSFTLQVEDSSSITVNAGLLDIGSAVTNILNSFNVNYVGTADGTFTYDPPVLSLLGAVTFDTSGMEAFDVFTVVGGSLEPDTTLFGGIDSAYSGGVLSLRTSGLLAQTVNVSVPMTQQEFDEFKANQSDWLSGGTFTFPSLAGVCFCGGTRILTPTGPRLVEDLRAGDLVVTEQGAETILWAGRSVLTPRGLDLCPDQRPVRIQAGAFGNGCPERDIRLSPQHKVLVNGPLVREMTGAPHAWIAVKHLIPLKGVSAVRPKRTVTYHHLLLRRHHALCSEGLVSESLHLGQHIMTRLPVRQQQQLTGYLQRRETTAHRNSLPVIRGGRLRQHMKRHGGDLLDLIASEGLPRFAVQLDQAETALNFVPVTGQRGTLPLSMGGARDGTTSTEVFRRD